MKDKRVPAESGTRGESDLVPIRLVVADSVVEATCAVCGTVYLVEPDAEDYDCYEGCGQMRTVTSPLVLRGFI